MLFLVLEKMKIINECHHSDIKPIDPVMFVLSYSRWG